MWYVSEYGDFNPRSLWGSDYNIDIVKTSTKALIHAPCGGATLFLSAREEEGVISIHAPCGERPFSIKITYFKMILQSTLPVGERPLYLLQTPGKLLHFNPRSLWGATRSGKRLQSEEGFQSTLPRGERPLLTNLC